ncbi:DUF2198 family protein, partial [Staphylococcus pettenkoferi]|uniref:DUF2198 family protein n=1 Tax=Staphylococcus pettenkoferi TaxID=170573 RepID=UPI00119FD98C
MSYFIPPFFPSLLILLFTLLTPTNSLRTLLTLIFIPLSLSKPFFHNQSIIFIHLLS